MSRAGWRRGWSARANRSPPRARPTSPYVAKAGGAIADVADLAGQVVVVPGGDGSISAFALSELLEQGGLTYEDVQPTSLSPADGLAAVQNGAAASTLLNEPLLSKSLSDGSVVEVGDNAAIWSQGNPGGLLLGPSLLVDNRPAAVALLRGLLRAVREDLQGDWSANDEVVQILSDASGIPIEEIRAVEPTSFDPDLTVSTELVPEAQSFWRSRDVLEYDEDLTVEDLVDAELLAAAIASYDA